MKHNLDCILKLDGTCKDDPLMASGFIKECLAEVGARLERMKKLVNLDVVLNDITFTEARSDLAGVRHFAQALMQAAGHHRDGSLGDYFVSAYKTANEKLRTAEAIFSGMKKLYPSL